SEILRADATAARRRRGRAPSRAGGPRGTRRDWPHTGHTGRDHMDPPQGRTAGHARRTVAGLRPAFAVRRGGATPRATAHLELRVAGPGAPRRGWSCWRTTVAQPLRAPVPHRDDS